jgi:succinate dehydrogenase / fumarate reductase iron-sulfur subunit
MVAHADAATERDIVFRIARQDRPGEGRYWQSFSVPHVPGMNVISALQYIAAHPNPLGSHESVTPVAWDCACLEEICGSCTMVINGKVMQSCSALVDHIGRTEAGEIELEPMSKYPVMRDLVVDRSRIFEGLKKVKAWIPVDGYYDAGPGPIQSAAEAEQRYPLSKCMTCGCCMEACPQYTKVETLQEYGESDAEFRERSLAAQNQAFMGAAIISQAMLFNSHPTGAMNKGERLEALMEPGGITDCGNSQNCVKVCPKLIPLTWSIGKAGRDTTVHAIKQFFLR